MEHPLVALQRRLERLMDLVNAGQWGSIALDAESFVRDIDAIRTHDISQCPPEMVAVVERNLQTLGQAIAICEERKTQIGPLVTALDRIHQAPKASNDAP